MTPNTPTSFDGLYDDLDPLYPEGARFAVDSSWSEAPGGTYFAKMAARVAEAPSSKSFALAAVAPPPPPGAPRLPEAAFSMAQCGFGLLYAIWDDPADDAANVAWLRGSADALAGHTVGYYVGEADLDRPGRLRGSFSPQAWQRLMQLRQTYDPKGIFARAIPDLLTGAQVTGPRAAAAAR
jgi:FAD/FMN-containing dehydrogenase